MKFQSIFCAFYLHLSVSLFIENTDNRKRYLTSDPKNMSMNFKILNVAHKAPAFQISSTHLLLTSIHNTNN